MNGIYIFLAEGYEPLEALAPADVLNRARLDAKFVSTTEGLLVPSAQGYGIQAHLTWREFSEKADMKGYGGCMIFPGGLPGADNLGFNRELMEMMKDHFHGGGLTAAICAAPCRVLARNLGKELSGRRMTMYDGFEEEIAGLGINCTGAGVEEDGNLITAKGPGLAVDFGLTILKHLTDIRVHDVVKHAMML